MLKSRSHKRGRCGNRRIRWQRLNVVGLEERNAPAQLIVTSSADDGSVGTLRAIVAISNKNGEADTITFDPAVTSITLAKSGFTISEGKNLTIDGGGTVSISGAGKYGILGLAAAGSPTVSIANITLSNANFIGYGGAVYLTTQHLVMTNASLLNNSSSSRGGAICLIGTGSASLNSCILEGNTARLGGAVYLDGIGTGSISLNSCQLIGNIAKDNGLGGAIFAEDGKIVIESCTIQNNQAGSWGGGIELERSSSATITNTTVVGNVAMNAGGIDIWRGSATMVNCTVAEHTAGGASGGIFFGAFDSLPQSLVIRNCTIAKNTVGDGFSVESGGLLTSILKANPTIQIDSTIIASNIVSSSFGSSSLDVSYDFGSSTLGQGSNNLFGAANGTITGTNNVIGTAKNPISAGLLPLGDYGGPTQTMPLQYNSIALDKGSNPLGLMFDQRGQPRESPTGMTDIGAVEGTEPMPFVAKVATMPNVYKAGGTAYTITVTYDAPNGIDLTSIDGGDIQVAGPVSVGPVSVAGTTTTGNQVVVDYQFAPPGGSWDKFDTGTYSVNLIEGEVWDLAQPPLLIPPQSLGSFITHFAANYVVDSIEDAADGNYGPGQLTLREAVQLANVFSSTYDTITFDPVAFSTSKTIVLSGELKVSTPITINGPGPNLLTLSGNGAHRIFYGGIVASGLTLANGRANYIIGSATDNGNGGAIYGSSSLVDCVLINNSAEKQGGAIYSGYSLSLTRCSIVDNSSLSGGAIYAIGKATLDNSTISGNSASNGGGLYLDYDSELVMRNSTVTDNSATIAGGAIYGYVDNSSPALTSVTFASTIVASNANANSPDFYFTQAVNVAGDNNLIGVADTGNITLTGANNLTGTLAVPLDPMLAPLADNGGATFTHALLPGSPAINAGSNAANLTTDQRGTGFARVVGGQADIGAFEVQTPPPRVLSMQVNDGSMQRSMVTNFKVTFSESVSFPFGISDAFQLRRTGPNAPIGLINLVAVQTGADVTITMAAGGAIGLDPAGSLMDGQYTLTIVADKILGVGGKLDGDSNGSAGGNYKLATHRHFGDSTGDGRVNLIDLSALRQVFGTPSPVFDFNNDGIVNAIDFAQFRARFGLSIVP